MKKNFTPFSFYARINTKTVLESLKDFLQTQAYFFLFYFSFSIARHKILYWLLKFFSHPYKISCQQEIKKIIEKKTLLEFVGYVYKILKLPFLLF